MVKKIIHRKKRDLTQGADGNFPCCLCGNKNRPWNMLASRCGACFVKFTHCHFLYLYKAFNSVS